MGGSPRITHDRYLKIFATLSLGGATLKDSTGMSANEIAEEMGLPRATVYRMLNSESAALYGIHLTKKSRQPYEYYCDITKTLSDGPVDSAKPDNTIMTFPKPTTTAEVIALEIYRSALALIPQYPEEVLARNWPNGLDKNFENMMGIESYKAWCSSTNENVHKISVNILLAYIWNLHRHGRQYLS